MPFGDIDDQLLPDWCFRSLPLLDNTYLHLSKALSPHCEQLRNTGAEYGCNMLFRKALDES